MVQITSNSPRPALVRRVTSGPARFTNADLPAGIDQRKFRKHLIQMYLDWIGTVDHPWDTHTARSVSKLQLFWDYVFKRQILHIQMGQPVFFLVSILCYTQFLFFLTLALLQSDRLNVVLLIGVPSSRRPPMPTSNRLLPAMCSTSKSTRFGCLSQRQFVERTGLSCGDITMSQARPSVLFLCLFLLFVSLIIYFLCHPRATVGDSSQQ